MNPVPIMKRKEAQDHYLANRSRSLEENDPHCLEFEKHYKPAFTYKALNKLIQGSAADMTKKAMVDLYKVGILPHIQIHDELCLSIRSREEAVLVKKTMEEAIILLVPNKVNAVGMVINPNKAPNNVSGFFGKYGVVIVLTKAKSSSKESCVGVFVT